ncbi:MAG: 2-keto-4-pentenoate hydratase [Pseudomonadota bacterium]
MPVTDQTTPAAAQLSPEFDAISRRLITARANAEALAEFPGQLPATLAEAYAVQSASIARWPDTIAGWKVGGIPEAFQTTLGAERLSGPIFEPSVVPVTPGALHTMPIYSGGFAALEAEFILRLGTTVTPAQRQWSDEELLSLVAALHVGAEIASSPMADVNRLGPTCVVCDFGNNAGLLVGPEVANWSRQPLESLGVSVIVDDVNVGAANAGVIDGGPLQALRFLLGLCAERQLALTEGTFVSCGAVTGIHEITTSAKAVVDFGSHGVFDVAFESMTPRQLSGAPAAT